MASIEQIEAPDAQTVLSGWTRRRRCSCPKLARPDCWPTAIIPSRLRGTDGKWTLRHRDRAVKLAAWKRGQYMNSHASTVMTRAASRATDIPGAKSDEVDGCVNIIRTAGRQGRLLSGSLDLINSSPPRSRGSSRGPERAVQHHAGARTHRIRSARDPAKRRAYPPCNRARRETTQSWTA